MRSNKLGQFDWLTLGRGAADPWTRKIFGIPSEKDKSWRNTNSDEQALLIMMSNEGYAVASPQRAVQPETPARMKKYVENRPLEFKFPEDTSDTFQRQYAQFFGTGVCNYAQDVVKRGFLQREIYAIFAREALREHISPQARQQVSEKSISQLFETNRFPKNRFGIVQEQKPGTNKKTNIWVFYNKIFTPTRANRNLWADVVQKVDMDETDLTESTMNAKYLKQSGGAPKTKEKRVSTDPSIPPKRPKPPGSVVLPDPGTFIGLMALLKEEAKKSKKGYTSIELVSKTLRIDSKLASWIDGTEKDPSTAFNSVKKLYRAYRTLIKPLHKGPHSAIMDKPTDAELERLGPIAKATLLRMHKTIVKTMVERPNLGLESKQNWEALFNKYYLQPGDQPAVQKKKTLAPMSPKQPRLPKKPVKKTAPPPFAPIIGMTHPPSPTEEAPTATPLPDTPPKKKPKRFFPSPKMSPLIKLIPPHHSPPHPTLIHHPGGVKGTPSPIHAWKKKVMETDPPVITAVLESPGLRNIADESASVMDSIRANMGSPRPVSARASPVIFRLEDEKVEADESEAESQQTESDFSDMFSDTSSQRTYRETEYLEATNLQARLRGIRDIRKFTPHILLHGFDVASMAPTMRTSATLWSTRARHKQPIGNATIIRLKDIKRRMGDKVELFSDESLLGFNRRDWHRKLFEKFPLDFSIGFKKHLGPFIKTNFNKKKKELSFIIRKNRIVRIIVCNSYPVNVGVCSAHYVYFWYGGM